MTAFGTTMTATYRGDGLRASKATSSGTTYFIYDTDKPVLEVNASGTKTAVTTFGPSGALARTTATRTLLYTADFQGNVSQQIDASSGSVLASYAFDSFGGRLVNSSDPTATSDPYSGYGGAMGYFTDWETGLQLLGHRFYDSTSGRFLNRDPMDTGGGINVYGYVSNNPLDVVDPSGYMGSGRGGGGGGVSHGGWGPGGRSWVPGHLETPPTGWGKADAGAMGCAMGAFGAWLTAALSSGGLDQSIWCPMIVACGMGMICGILGAGVGGGLQGCVVGMICGAASAALGQLCAKYGCGGAKPPSDANNWCQIVAGGAAGCIGGICGPPCAWAGAIAGGLAGAACNSKFP